ncbi:MAG TPA: response regulator [Thermodesulfobacteriota bacterium]
MADNGKTILVVEDEKTLLKLESILLKSRGYRVIGATSGSEALALVQQEKPDLVLLDVMLPGIDGFKVCAHLKGAAETRDIPVVMLTARTRQEDIARGREVGANEYITKPFQSAQVTRVIARLLGES